MTSIMRLCREVITWLAMLTIFCASAMKFPAASFNPGSRTGELETILEELRKELSINSKPVSTGNDLPIPSSRFPESRLKEQPNFESVVNYPSPQANTNPLLSILLSKDDNPASFGVEKRQGSWDYDYGLGGGRFGKRGFGDYSLGGGRFGRDVSHIKEIMDFDDPILD